MIVSIHGFKTYLDLPYRRLLDLLYEMPRIDRIIGLEPCELPDFSTVCSRMQGLKMPIWRRLLQLSGELHDTGETVRARTWFGQIRELVLKCAVRNVELALSASNG